MTFLAVLTKHSNDLVEDSDFYPKQAVSLARRMAGKKGAVVQLQAEINTEEDWDKLLTKDGLIVVDVYSDWCGPCVGMVGNLKKCKLEMGGDLLHLAIAKSDDIEVLQRFRNKSEPTWMFISGGRLLHVLFGANAPRLMQLIEAELKNETKVKAGELVRQTYMFDELTPEEVKRAAEVAARKAEEARLAAARELAARNEERDRRGSQMTNALLSETIILLMPQTVAAPDINVMELVEAALNPVGVCITENCTIQINSETWEEITYRDTLGEGDYLGCMLQGPCLALLVKCSQSPPVGVLPPEQLGDIEKLVWETISMAKIEEGKPLKPHPESIAAKFMWTPKKNVENVIAINGKTGELNQANGIEDSSKQDGGDASKNEDSENSMHEDVHDDNNKSKDGEDEEHVPVPGLYTPVSYLSKSAAVASLFPLRVQKIAVADLKQLPPRIVLMFDTSKADECFALVDNMPDIVTNIGFFSTSDLEDTVLIARSREHYSKISHSSDNRLIIAAVSTTSDPPVNQELLVLNPQYVSPNDTVGTAEADKLFPISHDIDLCEVPDDDEELGKSFHGGLTPTTAVTVK